MLNATQSRNNISVLGFLETVIFCTVSTVPCCVFLFINGTLLFTLRSKPIFRETSRYILLYNLLFADTVLLVHAQLMYILSISRVTLTYPVCGVLVMLANLIRTISPLTLVLMSLERYVAVCYPMQHASIITIRNTALAITVIWAFSSIYIMIQVILLTMFQLKNLGNVHMRDFCGKDKALSHPISDLFHRIITNCLFVLACLVVTSSYIGVMVAARSASTDNTLAHKARNTLLLHLVQLGLSLSSTIHNSLLLLISKNLNRVKAVRIQVVFYVCIIILPRCLSVLIYGLRDQTIRPVLMYNLCCHRICLLSLSAVPSKIKSAL